MRWGASFCQPQAETSSAEDRTDTKPETAHEKPLAPRVDPGPIPRYSVVTAVTKKELLGRFLGTSYKENGKA